MNGRELAALSGQENIVVIRRPFVEWLGHISDALLIDQVLFCQEFAGAGVWWHKSDTELGEKLCMSHKAIAPARARLIALGFIKTERRGQTFRTHYLADLDAIAAAFGAYVAGVKEPSHPNRDIPNGTTSHPKRDVQSSQTGRLSIEEGVKVLKGKSTPKPPARPASPAAEPSTKHPAPAAVARVELPSSPGQPPREEQAMFDSLCWVHKTSAAGVVGAQRGRFNKLVGEWRRDGVTADDLAKAVAAFAKSWKGQQDAVPTKADLELAISQVRAGKVRRGQAPVQVQATPPGAPENWRDVLFAPDGSRRAPQFVLRRLGMEEHLPPAQWPAWMAEAMA